MTNTKSVRRAVHSSLALLAVGSLLGCSSGEPRSEEAVEVEASALATSVTPGTGLRRVLVLSIDGMHATDLYKWVTLNPRSNIARLYQHGVDYPNATTTTPSGGLPGILALATGGTPRTTGVYHEDSYDRTLYPPGSTCTGSPGTEVIYDGSIAQNTSQLFSPIELTYLPKTVNLQGACVPVLPHEFLRASTIFEVIQNSGRRTSWADSHASYEILSGPGGKGLSEFYSPEVGSAVLNAPTAVNGVNLFATNTQCNSSNSVGLAPYTYANCLPAAQAYDDVKVQSVINKIDGYSANGSRQGAVPVLFGMNFVGVEVAQTLQVGGYLDALSNPTTLLKQAFQKVDLQIGRILTELNTKHYIDKTLVILTAKHGQAPIDPSLVRTLTNSSPVANPLAFVHFADPNVDNPFPGFVNPNSAKSPTTSGHVQMDGSAAIVWLQDQNNVNVSNVVQVLSDPLNADAMGASVRPDGSIFSANIASGSELSDTFGDPQSSDPIPAARAPNVFVQPNLGVIYSSSGKKADHGGGAIDDINVPLVVSNTAILQHVSIYDPVGTTQIALTILKALGRDGTKLSAANQEQTSSLPGIKWGQGTYQAGSVITAVDFDNQTNAQVAGTKPLFVGNFDTGSSICFDNVYLNDVVAIRATVGSMNSSGGTISVRLDNPTGAQLGSYSIQSTGGWVNWQQVSTNITATTGLHTLCFRGETSTGIANLLNFYLVPGTCVPECTNAVCGTDGCGGVCGTCGFNTVCDDPFAQCVTPPTKYSLTPGAGLSPIIQAPAWDVQSGTQPGAGNTSLVSVDANDTACYYGVDLTAVQSIVTTLASATAGGVFSFRLDSLTGTEIGRYTVQSTGGATTFVSKRIAVGPQPLTGVHALCVRGESGSGIAALQSFELSPTPVVPRGAVGGTVMTIPPDTQQGTTDGGGYVANFDTNDYVCYENVDLTGVNSMKIGVASFTGGGGVVSVRLGTPTGQQIGTYTVPNTGGWTNFVNLSVGISPAQTGLKTVCFFGVSGTGIGNFQSFSLSASAPPQYSVGKTITAAPPDSLLGVTSSGGIIGSFDATDWFCYNQVDLTDVKAIVASAASGANPVGTFAVKVGSSSGTQIGTWTASNTGGYNTYGSYRVPISATSGAQTLCIYGATGNGIANFQNLYLSPVP